MTHSDVGYSVMGNLCTEVFLWHKLFEWLNKLEIPCNGKWVTTKSKNSSASTIRPSCSRLSTRGSIRKQRIRFTNEGVPYTVITARCTHHILRLHMTVYKYCKSDSRQRARRSTGGVVDRRINWTRNGNDLVPVRTKYSSGCENMSTVDIIHSVLSWARGVVNCNHLTVHRHLVLVTRCWLQLLSFSWCISFSRLHALHPGICNHFRRGLGPMTVKLPSNLNNLVANHCAPLNQIQLHVRS